MTRFRRQYPDWSPTVGLESTLGEIRQSHVSRLAGQSSQTGAHGL